MAFDDSYPGRGCTTRWEQKEIEAVTLVLPVHCVLAEQPGLAWNAARFRWACSGKLSTMRAEEKAVEIGSASLTGIRGRVAKSVAKPIAQRTGLTREQVQAIIGFLIIAYGIYRVVRPLMRAARRTT